MSFEQHPIFEIPDDETKIWRYFDFLKFLSLLSSSSLYFTSLDKLFTYDPYEGTYTKLNRQVIDLNFDELDDEQKKLLRISSPNDLLILQSNTRKTHHWVKKQKGMIFVNGWHINNYESAAMWKVYSFNEQGIAIQSTVAKLKECFLQEQPSNIFIGKVNYIDYQNDVILMDNILRPSLYKRKSFEYENELRALIWTPQSSTEADCDGIPIKVDLNVLIDKIYLSPLTEHWIKALLLEITSRYSLQKGIFQSDLSDTEIY